MDPTVKIDPERAGGGVPLLHAARNDADALALAEERYRQLEARFRALEDATGQLVWMTDRDGMVEDIPGWRAFTGTTVADVRDLGWVNSLHPDDRPSAMAAWTTAVRQRTPYQTEYRVLRRDGVYRWFVARGMPILDANGDIREWVGTSTDITERRATEQHTLAALNALIEMAQALVLIPHATAPEGEHGSAASFNLADLIRRVLGCDRVGIMAIDPVTHRTQPLAVAGLSEHETAAWWEEQRTQATPIDSTTPQYAAFAAGQVMLLDFTQPPLTQQPNPYGIQVMVAAPMIVRGQLVGMVSLDHHSAHDYSPGELRLVGTLAQLTALIVEHERLLHEHEAAETRARALEDANARMDGFLHMVNHELKTPLTALRAYIDIAEKRLQRQLAPEESTLTRTLSNLHLVLDQAKEQGLRMTRLLQDLLEASSVNTDRLPMDMQTCDLARLVRGAVRQQRLLLPDREMTVRASLRQGAALVHGDPLRLAQVLTNYLNNALKYAPNQLIEVSVTATRADVRVAVTDHGPGISPADQARIWQRFERGDPLSTGSGLGLGLYISQAIITAHGGQVGVSSTPGQGATFWFTVPRVHTTAADAPDGTT
jgi:PAS domain S-box-containing protein